ncbi:phosphoglycerate dehydrogenase [Rhodocytophaga rosea]|uniref:Phosphoglycerate dehydrogenase n=1 Tax=Rhodocytophaga rosea TaxID=2704465 RepID=A0A6C0GPA4_9BACT|nr:2-hydroxyacid dehydrogenase [Rhodocytophaga rosea]QHT69871.1 phosphoglycerate dehydrogenase [Rhodocytophaga rosea]
MNILIADEMHPSLLPMLDKKGYQYEYLPSIQRAEILQKIPAYDGLIIRSKTTLNEDFFTHATRLKFIGRAGAGMDQIDVEAAEKRNITLFNAPEGNRDAVAEHAMSMLLCLFNKINTADQEVRDKVWKREANRGVELGGKTIGLIGYGNTGKAFARRLTGFNCQVLAYDKYLSNYSNEHGKEASMQEIFEQADVLSLHIPLTPETHALVNADFLNKFKKDIYLINTARGEIIPFRSVAEELKSGKIKGACLDVLENEKLQTLTPIQAESFEYLRQSNQVIFSPHVAGWTHESYVRINEVLVAKISTWEK